VSQPCKGATVEIDATETGPMELTNDFDHGPALITRRVRPAKALAVLGASLAGNLVGSIGFAALVHGGGSLAGPGSELVATEPT